MHAYRETDSSQPLEALLIVVSLLFWLYIIYKEQVNNVVILKMLVHINKWKHTHALAHLYACACEETSNKAGIQHRAHGDVTVPESWKAKFARFVLGLEGL